MPKIKKTAFEAGASFAGFFPRAGDVGEKDLRANGEDGGLEETIQQRPEESAVDEHVVVEENNDIRANLLDRPVVAAAETIIAIERQHPHAWKIPSNKLDASVGASVIDDKDFVVTAVVLDGFDNGRQALGK